MLAGIGQQQLAPAVDNPPVHSSGLWTARKRVRGYAHRSPAG